MSKREAQNTQHAPAKVREGFSMLLDCPSCHSLISADEIDLETGEATCKNCQHVFDFEEELRQDPFRRSEIVIPDGVDILKLNSMLDIQVDWYNSAPKRKIGSMVFSSFFWNIILIPVMLFLAFHGDFFLIIFFMGHVLTGLALVGYLVALFLNKTHIEVTSDGINIRHGPIPSPLNEDLAIKSKNIDQLYVGKYMQRFSKKSRKGIEAHALYAVTTNGKVIELIKGMNLEAQLYLEQEIEKYLKIKDVPIRGEVTRKKDNS